MCRILFYAVGNFFSYLSSDSVHVMLYTTDVTLGTWCPNNNNGHKYTNWKIITTICITQIPWQLLYCTVKQHYSNILLNYRYITLNIESLTYTKTALEKHLIYNFSKIKNKRRIKRKRHPNSLNKSLRISNEFHKRPCKH